MFGKPGWARVPPNLVKYRSPYNLFFLMKPWVEARVQVTTYGAELRGRRSRLIIVDH